MPLSDLRQRVGPKLALAGITLFVVVAGWWLYNVLNPYVGRSAQRHLVTLLDNNPDALYEFAGEEERNAGLSRDQFQRFWQEVAWPRFRECKQVGSVASEVNADGTSAIAEVDVITQKGNPAALGVTMYPRGGKAVTNLMSGVLTAIWVLDAADSKPPRNTASERFGWRKRMMIRDSQRLQALGLNGLWTYKEGFLTFEKLISRYTEAEAASLSRESGRQESGQTSASPSTR